VAVVDHRFIKPEVVHKVDRADGVEVDLHREVD
jgi:hypothetical protein